jgi:hypothetical protein
MRDDIARAGTDIHAGRTFVENQIRLEYEVLKRTRRVRS